MPLSPSQRISLIKEIADRLSSEGWPLIDLTLKQFSQPRADMWSGPKEDYVLEMIQDGEDHSLIELAQHVGFQFTEKHALRLDPPFWREHMFRLFVSHLAVHRAFAAE